jgi:hypothetical protein
VSVYDPYAMDLKFILAYQSFHKASFGDCGDLENRVASMFGTT